MGLDLMPGIITLTNGMLKMHDYFENCLNEQKGQFKTCLVARLLSRSWRGLESTELRVKVKRRTRNIKYLDFAIGRVEG